MAKIKYDVSKATAGGDWEHVKPGLYRLRLESMEHKVSSKNNPMFETRWRPVAEADGSKLEGEFSSVFYHVLTDGSQDGRMRMLTDALGLPAKGTIDTEAVKGSEVLGQLKSDKDQDGEYRPRLSKLMPLPEDAADLEAEEEDEEEADEEEELDLSTLDRKGLKALIKEHELGIKVLQSKSDDDLRAEIAEAFGGEEEEEEEEEDEPEPEEEEEDEVDLSSLNRTDLKAFIKDNELEVRVLKTMSDDDLRAAIAEAIGGEEEPDEEEEEEEDESNGYDSMGIQDLKNALKERGLNMSGKKAQLVARLTADDKKGGDPF